MGQRAAGPCVWRIVPAAAADDPTWLGLEIWSQVVVRAATSAEARIHAGCLARSALISGQSLEQLDRQGGFMSEKLYHVQPLSPEEASAYEDSGPGVLWARRRGQTGA
ncbi:MAG: hypothetical protein H6842_14735 [Rhodospirillaceae bacterium]|nr:hypothetical protein [Rhodospirillaceae bacterium]